ncbi:ComF family protein [Candidatus Thiothrix anitrata]|jgi:ComF family protein|uniref:ComF family protein n=1 Tax=Candidatus Thiothrix anitrata TaxID=2823902 RepID=A0ABX7X5C1_9GAMM|nr:phosphoribosyltransferase family protein [Candidatus Thiothrix anitrata]QTR50562.1 ComF family protein [Candidatus Thiothrix anitrata]
MLTKLLHITHHTLQPQCAFCEEPRLPDYPLCQGCHDDLPWLAAQYNHPIPGCDNSISAFAYQSPVSALLLSVKFGKRLRDLTTLGELTATGILPQISQVPQAILPVPLHSQRLHERGFNQALELARPLAKQLGIPLLTHHVVRHKATLRQTELDSTQRQQNLLQAFRLNAALPYTRIALFDDVITTGSTLQSLAQLLRANGVEYIEAWSCARPIQRRV